jgi:hypothetical protein
MWRPTAHQLPHAKEMNALVLLNAMQETTLLEQSTHPAISVISFRSNMDTLSGKIEHQSHALTQPPCKTLQVGLIALNKEALGYLETPTLTQINQLSEQSEKLLVPLQKLMVHLLTNKEVLEMRISDA